MGILNDLSIIIARLPIERLIFRGPNRAEQLDRLGKALDAAQTTTKEEPREAIDQRGGGISQGSLVSNEETVAYQNRELGKELLLLEKHLQQGCRIPPVTGEPCDCCSPKHTITIEALALETYGMTGDPLYQDIARWTNEVAARATIEQIESGRHDYGPDAVRAREYRKRVLGTESLAALIAPREQITLEEAKVEAARIAAEEVERAWHRSDLDAAFQEPIAQAKGATTLTERITSGFDVQ